MEYSYIKPNREKLFYVFAPENYGTGFSIEEATKNLVWREEKKNKILEDFNKYEIFNPEFRDYMAGLISRNWEEINKILEVKKNA